MTAPKSKATRPPAGGLRAAALPPVTVARFEESLELVERIAKEERTGFLREMQAFRDEHRDITRRPLTAAEAAEVAATMAGIVNERPEAEYIGTVQASDLYAYDDPSAKEVLVSAGMATAPAMVRAVRKFVALMELPADEFEAAFEADTLAQAIETNAKALAHVELADARARTVAAFEHWGRQAGVASGEVMRRLIETVMAALEQAATRVTAQSSPARSHLSTASPARTDGNDATSSTTSVTGTP